MYSNSSKKINPLIRWWVTPYLPYEDVFEMPLLINKSITYKLAHAVSKWLVHPIKRRVARAYLALLKKTTSVTTICITGSAGKTTTAQMIVGILNRSSNVVGPKPGIDSVYNVPNTILRCTPWTRYLVLEYSVEYVGEMDYYLWLAKPDIAVITNIFPTHTEYLKDVAGVLREKGKIALDLGENDFVVLNKDSSLLRNFAKNIRAKIIWSEKDNSAIARKVAEILKVSKIDIKKGLDSYVKPKHRMEVIKLKSGLEIFDDSYNSNPEALLTAANEFVESTKGRKRIAVLGDMLELGDLEASEHKRVGDKLSKMDLGLVIGVGQPIKYLLQEIDNSKKIKTKIFPDRNGVANYLSKYLDGKTSVLVKGSRSLGLEKLVQQLIDLQNTTS